MRLPRLHVVTDDAVLARDDFRSLALSLIDAHGPGLALHLRGHGTAVRRLFAEVEALVGPAADAGSLLVVNDRADVALAAGAGAVQLGRRSLPVPAARLMLGPDCLVGYSAHGVDEGLSAAAGGADYLALGTIWDTASHPGRAGAGLALLRQAAARVGVPVLAIGGVTASRTRAAVDAGAYGVAVIRGVWEAPDPVAAASEYLAGLKVVLR